MSTARHPRLVIHALLVALLLGAPLPLAGQPAEGVQAFRVGKVITMDAGDTVVNRAVVLVEGGRITAIGRSGEVEIPAGAAVHEHPDLWLVPGMVDAHNHTGGSSSDLHDYVFLTNPGYRTLESVVTESKDIVRAQSGGITSVLLIPGSGNNMSGFGTLLRTGGGLVEEAVVKPYGSIKVAQAGNPEGYFFGGRRTGRSFMNYNTRQTLVKAKEYHDRWTAFETGSAGEAPAIDPIFEGFRGLFRREFVASVHTQGYQVMMTTVDMLARKLGIRTVLDHCTFDGYKIAPLVLKDPTIRVINGPRQLQFDRSVRKIYGNAARWWAGGVRQLGINTDAPVIPQEELPYQATMACYFGWTPYEALKGITAVPAESLMLEEQGTIEVGKEASFGLWTGDPIDPRHHCRVTVVEGRVVYEAEVDRVF
ncbi:MAG: amidohydrolase family protein [Planctomycetota bacterium]|jgi:imidazolonepropionase-like amidohydrolase